ncbi:MAG: methyl-accepting chemotaxis protein [Defluviitaleaceae bacterium]|nr:methyl-accepting chemotaxis protein [Defluviitaleaceae bacterium]MCL2262884.1 methyl-accepting chemotaxis protein [Defluviitaleaceae bacterium]
MKNMSFKAKIILPTGLLIVALLAVVLFSTITRFSEFNDYLIQERLDAASYGMREFTDDIRRHVIDVGLQLSYDPRLAPAVLTGNTQEILRVGNQLVRDYNVTYLTVAGADTYVLARTDEPHRYGDAFRTVSLLEALEGIVSVAYTPVGNRLIPIRSSVPIFHQGEIIGVLVVGYALDTPEAVEALSQQYNAEITIFREDDNGNIVRISSTFTDERGGSVVGTYLTDPNLIAAHRAGTSVNGTMMLFGAPYSAYFMPFYAPGGEQLGSVLLALPLTEVFARRNATMFFVITLGAILTLAALVIVFFIITKLLAPVRHLTHVVSDVSAGRININRETNLSGDEIGRLTTDVYGLVDVIRNIVEDLNNAYVRYMKIGDMQHQIDATQYQNSFKEVIGSVNQLLNTNTADILDLSDKMNRVAEGDFSVELDDAIWPGDWKALPRALNNLTGNLDSVGGEINSMINAIAKKGDLSLKIDAAKYQGDWSKIMRGLNNITDAVEKPFNTLNIALGEMKVGNFDIPVIAGKLVAAGCEPDVTQYKGVFGEMISAIKSTIEEVHSYITEISDTLAEVANGNLTTSINRHYVGNFASIKDSLNNITKSLHKTMSEINSASEQVLSGSKQISTSAMDLANGAQSQASSVEELNASIDIINQQTRANADNAAEASDLSNRSTSNAQEGNEAMKQMLVAMDQIKESSNDISKIIKVIQDIAFQTNLLALNAAVEAARAGEHGKGFAVVAEEVRNLAARSQTAAEETTGLIGDSITRVESGASIAESTSDSLDTIVKNADSVMKIIQNISSSSQDQAEAIGQVSIGLNQISTVIQGNSAVSEEAAAASQELNSQAELLQELVSFFKL